MSLWLISDLLFINNILIQFHFNPSLCIHTATWLALQTYKDVPHQDEFVAEQGDVILSV